MDTEQLIDDSINEVSSSKRNRDLLPWWIKVFCWIFMIFGLISFLSIFSGIFKTNIGLSFYGFETNNPYSITGFIIISAGILKGITALALWLEKDFAIKIGEIDAILGIILCIIAMVLQFVGEYNGFHFRLEILLLVPFLKKLNSIEKEWSILAK